MNPNSWWSDTAAPTYQAGIATRDAGGTFTRVHRRRRSPHRANRHPATLGAATPLLPVEVDAVAVEVCPYSRRCCAQRAGETLYSLSRKFKRAFIAGAVTSVILLALSIVIDFYYYGRWTSSVLNILIYNVAGGGESHLYGTEGPLFYLGNGFNNFNFCFVLALLFLGIFPIAKKKYAPDLLIVVSPIYTWLGFMSFQPHKEGRFLYPIYPLICVAASAVIESFPDPFCDKYNPYNEIAVKMQDLANNTVQLSLASVCFCCIIFVFMQQGALGQVSLYSLLANVSGPDQRNVANAIFCTWVAVGNVLGYSSGASGTSETLLKMRLQNLQKLQKLSLLRLEHCKRR